MFLKSQRQYEWPIIPRWRKLIDVSLALLSFGMTARFRRIRWARSGEVSVWPFSRWSDYRAALRSPVYLAGFGS